MPEKKILFVLPNLTLGGIQTQSILIASHLISKFGWQVSFLGVRKKSKEFTDLLTEKNIKFYHKPSYLKFKNKSRFSRISAVIQAVIFLRKNKFDVVMPFTSWIVVLFNVASFFTKVKLCFFQERGARDWPSSYRLSLFEKMMVKNKPVWVTNSDHAKNNISKIYKISPSEINTIKNGVIQKKPTNSRTSWRNRLGLTEEAVLVVMVANFFKQKDHMTIIESWNEVLKKSEKKIMLAFAGGDSLNSGGLDKAKNRVKELGLEEKIIFLGPVEDNIGLLKSANIGLLSTLSEGCPNVILEYMSCSLPIVATNIVGVREVVGENNEKYLFSPGDISACTLVLHELIDDDNLRKELGEKNKRIVTENYSTEKMCMEYEKLFVQKGLIGR